MDEGSQVRSAKAEPTDSVTWLRDEEAVPAWTRRGTSAPTSVGASNGWLAWRVMTTKPDHNGNRQRAILADPSWLHTQVSDGGRQSGRILRSEGHGYRSC